MATERKIQFDETLIGQMERFFAGKVVTATIVDKAKPVRAHVQSA